MLRLINDYLKGEKHAVKMLDENDFYIVPVVNPDGESNGNQPDSIPILTGDLFS